MNYLLDTNAVIALLKAQPSLSRRVRQHRATSFGLPAPVLHELFYGAFKSRNVAANLATIEALRFEIVAFDQKDARRAGEIRAMLANAGTPIGPLDTLIAAQALTRGLTLLTHNSSEFARVPGLVVEDWESPSSLS